MRRVDYCDDSGRTWRTILPDDADDSAAPLGVPVGPPDLSGLRLPREVAVRLHNQLHARRIFTLRDARRRTHEVVAALQAAYRVDATRVIQEYAEKETPDGH